jgi:hypothetical protein
MTTNPKELQLIRDAVHSYITEHAHAFRQPAKANELAVLIEFINDMSTAMYAPGK